MKLLIAVLIAMGVIGVIGSIEYVHAQTGPALTIPKPDNFPNWHWGSKIFATAPGSDRSYWYNSERSPTRFCNDNGTVDRQCSVGDMFVTGPRAPLAPNPLFSENNTKTLVCSGDLDTVKNLLAANKVPGLAVPSNIVPQGSDNIIAIGLDFHDEAGQVYAGRFSCGIDFETSSDHPLFHDREVRFTLYGKSDKVPYYFSPRDNMNQAQPIPACSFTNFDRTTQTLKGVAQMCYGIDDNNMVIITKRVMGFYGAADSVSTPSEIVDLNIDAPSSLLTLYFDISDPLGSTTAILSDENVRSGYLDGGEHTLENTIALPRESPIGNLYFRSDTLIPTNSIFTNDQTRCGVVLESVKNILTTNKVPGLAVPSNIMPQGNDSINAIGFDVYEGNYGDGGQDRNSICDPNLERLSSYPLTTTKEIRFTLYDKSDKIPYYFSPRDNINEAQPIPACTTSMISSDQTTLRGSTTMCYGKHGDDIIIITKRVMGFYGAADSVSTPTIPDYSIIPRPPTNENDVGNAPTFGTSPITGEQLVTCGYKMDDTCRDVTAYHVQYERDTIQTNTTHTFALKALAPNMVDSFILAFGVPEIGSPISAAEAYITAKLAVNYSAPSYYNIIGVTVHDPNNIIDYDITNTEISRVSCSGGTLECAQVTFSDVLFRETLQHEPFVVMITDTLLYTSINYMNEGILVTGTPLNKQPTVQPGITVDTGDIRPTKLVLIRTDKVNDLWADAFGNTWSRNSFGNYVIVEYAPYAGTVPVCDDINDRLCAPFKAKLDWHNQRMIELRDSLYTAYITKAYAEIDNIFAYEFGDMDSRTRTLINLGWLTE